MKLLRYGPEGHEKPGVLDADGVIRDLSGLVSDINGDSLSPEALKTLSSIDLGTLPVVPGDVRLGPCMGRVGNLICVGLNYAEHARESNVPLPTEPVLFSKATSAISGPFDDVVLPEGSEKTDWEVELAFVICRPAYRVSQDDALSYVAGYCICHDVSERSFQLERGGQWVKGKSSPTFAPLGPWLVTADEVGDPQSLAIWLELNGVRHQDSSTADMVFSVAQIIAYATQFMRLMPGDVVTTGTPAGVGMGMNPPTYLKAGDRLELCVERLGRQRQIVRAFAE